MLMLPFFSLLLPSLQQVVVPFKPFITSPRSSVQALYKQWGFTLSDKCDKALQADEVESKKYKVRWLSFSYLPFRQVSLDRIRSCSCAPGQWDEDAAS